MDITKEHLEGEILPDLRTNATYTISLHTGIITLLPSLGKKNQKLHFNQSPHLHT